MSVELIRRDRIAKPQPVILSDLERNAGESKDRWLFFGCYIAMRSCRINKKVNRHS